MTQNIGVISPALGNLVSEAIEEFARKLNLKPDSYDLWYHDEPVWIVRSRELTQDGKSHLVRRVQICPFRTNEQPRLTFIPDVYLYNLSNKTVSPKLAAETRKTKILSLDLNALTQTKREEAKSRISDYLWKAWGSTKEFAL